MKKILLAISLLAAITTADAQNDHQQTTIKAQPQKRTPVRPQARDFSKPVFVRPPQKDSTAQHSDSAHVRYDKDQ